MIAGLNNDFYGYYRQGKEWAITRNGEYWITYGGSLDEVKALVERLNREEAEHGES